MAKIEIGDNLKHVIIGFFILVAFGGWMYLMVAHP
jgi:hypothetical protein